MNCQDFELIAGELAGDQVQSVKTRVSALAHAEACDQCAARLNYERSLENMLRAYASSTENKGPSPRQKELLRSVFEAQHNKAVTQSAEALNVVSIFQRKRQWQWALAAAAVIAILFAVASVWISRESSPKNNEVVADATPVPTVTPSGKKLNTPEIPRNEIKQTVSDKKNDREFAVKRPSARRKVITDRIADDTVAANYIPLSYAAHAGRAQDKLVVRVEVSRSALIAMGLPLNAERGNELVKADLMVGLDGVPLAIRLVRQ